MIHLRLTGGAPDEPDSSDWDAICDAPGPRSLFASLFEEVGGRALPAQGEPETSEDASHRVHIIWCGTPSYGVKVTEIESVETTAFPMICTRESFGLPGMKLTWKFELHYAGQLGYAVFRHRSLEVNFDGAADQKRFAEIWQRIYGRAPVLAPV